MTAIFYSAPAFAETKVRSNHKAVAVRRILASLSVDRAEIGRISETAFMLCLFAGCASLTLGAFAAAFVRL